MTVLKQPIPRYAPGFGVRVLQESVTCAECARYLKCGSYVTELQVGGFWHSQVLFANDLVYFCSKDCGHAYYGLNG